ncbi:MAG TPA: HpsJ family protein [Oculatellaceae cyanobacterium]
MTASKKTQWDSSSLLALVGYSLLGLTLFDILDIFIPPKFLDPAWEFEALGNVIERVPLPLLALGLILYSETKPLRRNFISKLSLVLGLLFFLMVPLFISDTLRLNAQNEQQAAGLFSQQQTQIQQVKSQITNATTAPELENLQNLLKLPASNLNSNNPEQLKKQLLAKVAEAENALTVQTQAEQRRSRNVLLKKSLKWIVAALISGFVLITMWVKTRK